MCPSEKEGLITTRIVTKRNFLYYMTHFPKIVFVIWHSKMACLFNISKRFGRFCVCCTRNRGKFSKIRLFWALYALCNIPFRHKKNRFLILLFDYYWLSIVQVKSCWDKVHNGFLMFVICSYYIDFCIFMHYIA